MVEGKSLLLIILIVHIYLTTPMALLVQKSTKTKKKLPGRSF